MDKFEYNDEQSRSGNYDRWKQMNNRERFQYNERPLSSEQAITINDKWRKGTFWERKDNWSYDANGAPVKGESNE